MDDKVKAFWTKFCNEKKLSKDIKYESWSFGNTKVYNGIVI